MRIVVTGLAATYPYGGVFWDYAQYLLGFYKLGHDVLYVEDTGKWCYDPDAATFVEAGTANARRLQENLVGLEPELRDRWFFRDGLGNTYGREWNSVVEFCRSADLFLHISASCLLRDEYLAAKTVAFVDSDPLYTQAGIFGAKDDESAAERTRWWVEKHDTFFTFGENIYGNDCLVPRGDIQWIPTRQPIVLECFAPAIVPLSKRRQILTTVASWEPREDGPLVDGVQYYGKSREIERFVDLPAQSPLPLELAMSGPAPLARLREKGWMVRDALDVSRDPASYRSYLASSFGEWSIAKNAYVASRSGWFSCRTACYLALGVPAVVQDTGFGCAIPTGEGVLSYRDTAEATQAIESLVAQPQRHSEAALEIAREHFAHDRVLEPLIERIASDP